jgi:hypothetical protein
MSCSARGLARDYPSWCGNPKFLHIETNEILASMSSKQTQAPLSVRSTHQSSFFAVWNPGGLRAQLRAVRKGPVYKSELNQAFSELRYSSRMDDPNPSEMSFLRILRQTYASLAAWMARDNRALEPGRLPCETRNDRQRAQSIPSRPFVPVRHT